jgi:hypothetical protein
MTASTRNGALRISLAVNALLFVALLALGAWYMWREWVNAQVRDARPKGAIVTLHAETRIVSPDAPTILLPKGTILQESTPQGAATLGKITDRQYLLTIKTEDGQFTKNRPYERSANWAEPYTFAASVGSP